MSYQKSTLERLMSSVGKTFSRASDLGEAKMVLDATDHSIHEGDPYKKVGTSRTNTYSNYIPGDMPIGDQEKRRREMEEREKQNKKILIASMRDGTIQSNR
jgi:hypothetical protein